MGLLLVVAGVGLALVSYGLAPPSLARYWPTLLVVWGVIELVSGQSKTGRVLEHMAPGMPKLVTRPHHLSGVLLILVGMVLQLVMLNLIDSRIVVPVILVLLGAVIVWRYLR